MDNNYTVYIHSNKINNKKYIGITKQKPEERWRHDGFGYRSQIKFWRAIEKYGWDNFEHIIVKNCLTAKEAGKLEQELIKKYNSIENGYNISPGGDITNHSPETLEKMRQSMLGKKHSEETKKKISDAKSNEKIRIRCIDLDIIFESEAEASLLTNTDKSSIGKCCKGLMHSAGGHEWEYADLELKEKYKKIKENNVNKSKKKVKCLTTGKIYESVTAAAKDTGSDPSNITKVCNGRYKTTNNLKWTFNIEEDYE